LHEGARQRIAQSGIAQQHRTADRAQHPKDRIALRRLLAPLRMARGDMADFMPQHGCQLGFVVHQRHQLPGGVDIAARHREGIVDGRIEQADGEAFACVAKARLHRDILAHLLDIERMGTRHRAAEFGVEADGIVPPPTHPANASGAAPNARILRVIRVMSGSPRGYYLLTAYRQSGAAQTPEAGVLSANAEKAFLTCGDQRLGAFA